MGHMCKGHLEGIGSCPRRIWQPIRHRRGHVGSPLPADEQLKSAFGQCALLAQNGHCELRCHNKLVALKETLQDQVSHSRASHGFEISLPGSSDG